MIKYFSILALVFMACDPCAEYCEVSCNKVDICFNYSSASEAELDYCTEECLQVIEQLELTSNLDPNCSDVQEQVELMSCDEYWNLLYN